ncbi:MAG: hypothetical protein HY299_06960 [Verrucomicrobia bacterium]|nr:hypothetical protein [Verrucomicrobiota bacterium]
MGKVFTNPSFGDWIRQIFEHPVAHPAWYWDVEADRADLEPQRVVDYAQRLFESAPDTLSPYTDEQANQGLWFLIGESSSPLYDALTDSDVPPSASVSCIMSISSIFADYFVPRCTPHLSHLDEPGSGPLNPVCYMWWDIFPLCGEDHDPARREIDAACMSVMEATLELSSVACQESALHGLGHWGFSHEERCRSAIERFLGRDSNIRHELRAYALRARDRDVA